MKRSGRLMTALTKTTSMLGDDALVTYKDIESSLRIGSGSVAKILHTCLRVS